MTGKPLSYNATLLARTDFTPQLATFRVRLDEPPPQDPAFLPGQYVAVGLNNEVDRERGSVRRSMSIASAPEDTEALEFYIRYVDRPASDNPLTHLLWSVEVGDRLYVRRKAVGRFTLADTLGETSTRMRILIAAGTGLAPFLSMIRSLKLREPKADMSRIVLIHGASYATDLAYAEELTGYAAANGLRYLPSVSRPHASPGWPGASGRAEDFLLPERINDFERRIGIEAGSLSPQTAGVLVCGLQGTIGRCVERLATRGFVPYHRKLRRALGIGEEVPSSLWWEQYDAEPVVDVRDAAVVDELVKRLGIAAPCGASTSPANAPAVEPER